MLSLGRDPSTAAAKQPMIVAMVVFLASFVCLEAQNKGYKQTLHRTQKNVLQLVQVETGKA